jgi:hypothetical protein
MSSPEFLALSRSTWLCMIILSTSVVLP